MSPPADPDPPPAGPLPAIAERALRLLPLVAFGNLLLAAPALIISLAVAYFTFIQAEATQKMQIASVWPMVSYSSSNLGPQGQRQIDLSLVNNGVGPARIKGVEVRYRDQPQADFRALLHACCAAQEDRLRVTVGTAAGEVLRPGADMLIGRLQADGAQSTAHDNYNRARLELRVRLCYCSVFDDCWLSEDGGNNAVAVSQCPTDWVQFNADNQIQRLLPASPPVAQSSSSMSQ